MSRRSRFDERGVETEAWCGILAPADERASNSMADLNPPRHSSTLPPSLRYVIGR